MRRSLLAANGPWRPPTSHPATSNELNAYGATANVPYWDSRRLLTVYVVPFLVMALVITALRFTGSQLYFCWRLLMYMGAGIVVTW